MQPPEAEDGCEVEVVDPLGPGVHEEVDDTGNLLESLSPVIVFNKLTELRPWMKKLRKLSVGVWRKREEE